MVNECGKTRIRRDDSDVLIREVKRRLLWCGMTFFRHMHVAVSNLTDILVLILASILILAIILIWVFGVYFLYPAADKVPIVAHTALNCVMTCSSFETNRHFNFKFSPNFNLGCNFNFDFSISVYQKAAADKIPIVTHTYIAMRGSPDVDAPLPPPPPSVCFFTTSFSRQPCYAQFCFTLAPRGLQWLAWALNDRDILHCAPQANNATHF